MSYNTIPKIARDAGLKDRIHAAIIQEDTARSVYKTPAELAVLARQMEFLMWQFATQPQWAREWETALAGDVKDPGTNPDVITDNMILSAVQTVL